MIALPDWATRCAKRFIEQAPARPAVAVVLGSGLAAASERIHDSVTVDWSEVEGAPLPGAPGHEPRAACGFLGTTPVIAFLGRVHLYEGVTARQSAFAVDVAAALECHTIVLTNAAGGLRPGMAPGDFMCITDHLNLMGADPLAGEPAFVDMAGAYDDDLKREVLRAADPVARMHQGVFAAVAGPTFETAAEIEMLRRLGADAVGMSTVPEAIVARAHGLRVIGISCITDVPGEPLTHEGVLEVGREAAPMLGRILEDVLADIKTEGD